ncbi:MAG: hypothetical protein RIM80_05310, partial [Alphaproteobacteria bacterium]
PGRRRGVVPVARGADAAGERLAALAWVGGRPPVPYKEHSTSPVSTSLHLGTTAAPFEFLKAWPHILRTGQYHDKSLIFFLRCHVPRAGFHYQYITIATDSQVYFHKLNF